MDENNVKACREGRDTAIKDMLFEQIKMVHATIQGLKGTNHVDALLGMAQLIEAELMLINQYRSM